MVHSRSTVAFVISAVLAGAAGAQSPPDNSGFQSQDPSAQFAAAAQPARPSMRLLFAQTLAAAAHSMGTGLVMGVAQALTGGLTNWLERKSRPRQPTAAAPVQPAAGFNSPEPAAASFAPAPSSDAVQQAAQPVQFFDAQSGQPAPPDPALTSADTVANTPAPASTTVDLFAGLAFEVHLLAADGNTTPVNPAVHEFRTGDRFVIFFRPTLPGRMEVYNVNPAGQQLQIDQQSIAAGQLTRLGPYEFAAQTGDEQLKLVIVPCTTPDLTVATRDIVNVAPAPNNSDGLSLDACQPAVRSIRGLRTRDIRTRDIRRVAVEGGTTFALDPVTTQERQTGNLAPREVAIVMRHR